MIHLSSQERQALLFVSFLVALGFLVTFLVKSSGSNSCLRRLYTSVSRQSLDINQATRDELIALPVIGEKMADAILLLRQEQGNFTDLGELKKIKGMTDAKLEKLKGYLSVKMQGS
jgi:competence ComEA-like helix-hairpin-helix protein